MPHIESVKTELRSFYPNDSLFICFFNSQEFTFIKKPIHYHLTWMYKDLQHNYYVTIAFFFKS